MSKKRISPALKQARETIDRLVEDCRRARDEANRQRMKCDKLVDQVIRYAEQNRELLKIHQEHINKMLEGPR